jgi:glycosyltransferase involved in cell wall biosynthesis
MPEPLVSVLIPVYNGLPYLAECLDSVLAQDLEDFELVILDDGSTDGSRDLIEHYARRDSRIRWSRNPHNLGLGGNFNACLRAAKGQFCKYVLQDDKFLHPSALRQMVDTLQANPSASLVASASEIIDSQSRRSKTRNHFGTDGVYDGKRVIVHCLKKDANLIGEPSLVLFRKSQAARGYDERFRQLLDLELWFHLLEQGSFAYLSEPLCAFRQHPAQQTLVNKTSGVSKNEQLMLAEIYFRRPWMTSVASAYAIFLQARQLRRFYGQDAAPLLEDMVRAVGPARYAACWLYYKVQRPFENLHYSMVKRNWIPEPRERIRL